MDKCMIREWLAPMAGLAGDTEAQGRVWASEKVSGVNRAGQIGQAEPGYPLCM